MNYQPRTVLVAVYAFMGGISLHGQNWCVPGSTWWYEHWGFLGSQVGIVHVVYENDTVVMGETAHRATTAAAGYDYAANMPYQFTMGDVITKSTMDQVSYWDGTQWHLLFDLSAAPADQWILSGYNFTDRIVEVSDTGHIFVGSETLRYSTVTFSPPFQGMTEIDSDTIVERSGYKRLFLDPNRTVGMDGDIYDLRCYQDNEILYTMAGDADCDFHTGSITATPISAPILMPNPGSDMVWLKGAMIEDPFHATIYDARGIVALTNTFQPRTGMDMRLLAPGLYTIVLNFPDGKIIRVKWIKE